MYSVDKNDVVVKLTDVPQSSVGAPCPIIFAAEHAIYLVYYLQDTSADWDGTTVRMVDENTDGEPVAVIVFSGPKVHMFGPPNDEAFSGHPLASRGLGPYGVYEIQNSSWIRQLVEMNSVHEHHHPGLFSSYRHFVFSFHDSTFECVAEGFTASSRKMSATKALQAALAADSIFK